MKVVRIFIQLVQSLLAGRWNHIREMLRSLLSLSLALSYKHTHTFTSPFSVSVGNLSPQPQHNLDSRSSEPLGGWCGRQQPWRPMLTTQTIKPYHLLAQLTYMHGHLFLPMDEHRVGQQRQQAADKIVPKLEFWIIADYANSLPQGFPRVAS